MTVYMDDILIYSMDLEEHRCVVCEVLKRLQDNDMYLKPSKCSFEQPEVEYLGVIVAHNIVKMDPVKVKALTE